MDNILKNKYIFVCCLILILFIGIFARSWKLGEIPYGVHQDEVNLAYDAYSLLKIGVDKEAVSYPVHLTSYYLGQGALMAYLSMPFIALLGLNIFAFRLLPCVLAIIAFCMMCFLFKKTMSNRGTVIACLITALIPWGIAYARWALESTSLPSLIVIALFFFYYFLEKRNSIYLSLGYCVLALASYCYGSGYIVIPIIGFLITVYLLLKRTVSFVGLGKVLIIPVLIVLPNLLLVVIHYFKLPSFSFLFFTIPEVRGLTTRISLNFPDLYHKYVSAFRLLYHNFDSKFYYISCPLLLLGMCRALKRREPLDILFFTVVVAALIMFAFITIHEVRILYLIPALVYFISVGAAYLVDKWQYFLLILIGLYLYYFALFFNNYFFKSPVRFTIGLDTAAGNAEKYCPNRTVFFTDEAPIPSAIVLFGSRMDPALFQRTKEKVQHAFWGEYRKFGRYEVFNKNKPEIDLKACYILPKHRLDLVKYTHEIVKNPQDNFFLAVARKD
ncbi:MAG: glycosyltransferase family 39 protein [Deltaproteobacteria bacterium]|jgi:4-amino-4-deoxy-L-arabinose transferase-like glycosyltransferase|nr:glycosyltransferase family 39 protein [Deltaproteobacteria bacterium]